MTDIFDRLKQDHDLHRDMLAKLADTSGDSAERREGFEQFRIEVSAHAAAEEESLYAVMLQDPELREEGQHSVSEHKEIDDFLEELEDIEMSSPGWMATFKKMRHRYEHHIDEEEEEIFPAAKQRLDAGVPDALKAKFDERKPEERERAEEGTHNQALD
ncbi:hemerythrin domain-containing protein [Novosphingopyxis sp.]|uniref:hemerythrin domain-containing protein n=1 Tax=Novosphingopyxis sp. TaxID=2709690 RepID=UPI003B5BB145